jgi:antitoxin ParD1/3/4
MSRSLNVPLPKPMREFVNEQAGENSLYATPSEYIRSLVRQDMEAKGTVIHVLTGLDDIRHDRLSKNSILDILKED